MKAGDFGFLKTTNALRLVEYLITLDSKDSVNKENSTCYKTSGEIAKPYLCMFFLITRSFTNLRQTFLLKLLTSSHSNRLLHHLIEGLSFNY